MKGVFRLGSQNHVLRFERGQEMINPIICCKFIKVFGHFQLRKYSDPQLLRAGACQQPWQCVAEGKNQKY